MTSSDPIRTLTNALWECRLLAQNLRPVVLESQVADIHHLEDIISEAFDMANDLAPREKP